MATITIGKYAITKVVELERPFAPAREFFPDLTANSDAIRPPIPI
jgi:hypothetical protein